MEQTFISLQTQTIHIKAGESLDVLTAIQKPGTEEALQQYYAQVFPAAVQQGFKSDGAFIPVAPPTEGNFHTSFIGLMSWPNEAARLAFAQEASTLSYNFLEERKNIWSVFNLSQYNKLEKDINFSVSSDKVYVVTAYWIEDADTFRQHRNQQHKAQQEVGAKLLMVLGKGTSPKGYFYEPDVYTLVEWNSAEAFQKHQEQNKSEEADGIKNLNQWITKFLFR